MDTTARMAKEATAITFPFDATTVSVLVTLVCEAVELDDDDEMAELLELVAELVDEVVDEVVVFPVVLEVLDETTGLVEDVVVFWKVQPPPVMYEVPLMGMDQLT